MPVGLDLRGDARVQGNPSQLAAIVENLVVNAERHGAAPIRVVLHVDDRQARVEVHDAGPGISPANHQRVFERFFTTRRGEGGTGLGLAIARTIARAHGGELVLRSAPGETVFTLLLPVDR